MKKTLTIMEAIQEKNRLLNDITSKENEIFNNKHNNPKKYPSSELKKDIEIYKNLHTQYHNIISQLAVANFPIEADLLKINILEKENSFIKFLAIKTLKEEQTSLQNQLDELNAKVSKFIENTIITIEDYE